MSIITFSSEIPVSLRNHLIASLDSYFFLGGKRTKIVSVDSSGYALAVRENVRVSTCLKILKILSLLFFPLILIALALRKLLHASFKRTYRILYVSSPISEMLPREILEHPTIFQRALHNASAGFFHVPSKYQNAVVKQNALGQISELSLSVNIDRILDNLDLSSLTWACSFLKDLEYYEGEGCEQLQTIIYKEGERDEGSTDDPLGYESKRILAKILLNFIFNKGMLHEGLKHDPTVSADQRRSIFFDTQPKEGFSLFPDVFFNMQKIKGKERLGCGYIILSRLEKLGIKPVFVTEKEGFSILWGVTPGSECQDCNNLFNEVSLTHSKNT